MVTSFDTTYALSSMYLWLLFAFLSSMVNCDLQRFMQGSQIVRHLTALIAFFFLFTLIDSSNTTSLSQTLIKTVFVYIIFVLSTKSKWYFAVPVLVLLLVDQSIKKHVSYMTGLNATATAAEGVPVTPFDPHDYGKARRIINIAVIVIVIIGSIQYMTLQYIEYGGRFSFSKFIVGTDTCKKDAPLYIRTAGQKRGTARRR